MSKDQSDYVTEAMEMMGMAEPKQIITEVSGFVPVFDVVIKHFQDPITALVFGRIWQYCGMADGVCKASLDKIGKDLGMSAATIMRHADKLVNDEYIIDTTPNLKNKPHIYLDGRKVEMKSRFSASISERNVSISERNASVSSSQLIKQDNTSIKKRVSLSPEEINQVNREVDYLIDNAKKDVWQGRELIRDNLLSLADWYNRTTGQVMTKRVQKSWWKALQDWQDEGLTPEHLQVAYEAQSKWRMVSDPNQLTKDACAVKAAGNAQKNDDDFVRLL